MEARSLKSQVSSLKPQASSLKPQVSSLKPHLSSQIFAIDTSGRWHDNKRWASLEMGLSAQVSPKWEPVCGRGHRVMLGTE